MKFRVVAQTVSVLAKKLEYIANKKLLPTPIDTFIVISLRYKLTNIY